MNKLSLIALPVAFAFACGDGPDQSVNPSDVATISTGAAILDSALDDVDLTADNSITTTSSNTANNTTVPTSGQDPGELGCTAQLRVSGAETRNYGESTGCGTGGFILNDMQTITWLFEDSWRIRIEGAPVREASDTSDFTANVVFGPPGSADGQTGWLATCTISLSSATGYSDDDGDRRSVWTGSANCPDPATPVETTFTEWESVDGDPITIESFSFVTPYPRAD